MSRPRTQQNFKPISTILRPKALQSVSLVAFGVALVGAVAYILAGEQSMFANWLAGASIIVAISLLDKLSPLSRGGTASSKEANGATRTMDMHKSG